jgi:hypothetical protein
MIVVADTSPLNYLIHAQEKHRCLSLASFFRPFIPGKFCALTLWSRWV